MIQDKQDNQCIVEEKIAKVTGENIFKKYNKGRLLGKGGFAKCYEFTNLETNKITAAKVIAKSSLVKSRAKQKLISEIKIHKALHHPNIVEFEHYFEDSENVYLLLEICHNQSLNELLKRRKNLTELEVQCYTLQIVKALKYLHLHKIIHRDLKLGNLFISEKMEVKVGDFGLATRLEFEGERKRTVCGTPNYIAPEILDGKIGHSYEVDVWSLGVIIYTLIIGKPPFETNNVKETYKRIKNNNYSFPEKALISDPAKELIKSILVIDPTKRPTLDDLLSSDFLNMGTSIPKLLPTSTLACPPSLNLIRQYMPEAGSNGLPTKPINRLGVNGNNEHNKNNLHMQEGENSTRPFTSTINYNNIQGKSSCVSGNSNDLNGCTSQSNNEIYVKKWIDYSAKYGLGYVLSNALVGVYFNDATKIIFKANGLNFAYIERKPSQKMEIITMHLLSESLSKDINKKVILLKHFKNYLFEEKVEQENQNNNDNIEEKSVVYVKKWMRTKHANLFRLSNKIVQVCFLDQTEILLSSESKMVTYVNKKAERLIFSLSNALDSNNFEMTKRLKYTKDILTHMLTKKHGDNQQNEVEIPQP